MTWNLDRSVFRGVKFALLVVAAAVPAVAPYQAVAQQTLPAKETWQVIYIGPTRVGYSRSSETTLVRDRRTIVRTENEDHLKIKRFGDELTMEIRTTIEEHPNGDMLWFSMETRNPPAAPSVTTGRVDGRWLHLERKIAGRTTRESLAWTANAKSPAYQDRVLRESPLRPGESLSFEAFEPSFDKITTVKMTADDVRSVELLDGKEERLLKVRVNKSVLPEVTMRGYITPQGELRKIETGLLNMVAYAVPKEVALESIAGAELDLAVNTLVRVPSIRNAHDRKKIVYRITTPGTDPTRHLPAGDTQQVRKLSDDSAELTVTAVRAEPTVRRVATKDEYLEDSRYLQTSDVHVQEHARRAAAGDVDPAKIAVQMERYVFEKLSKKDFSTALASAAEVAQNLEGDCTEHAVLLAAMLRAQRIPSRIAVGVVYVPLQSAFAGHMWTEAFLGGRWIPLDATRGEGGVNAAHIKLGDASFSDGTTPATAFVPLLQVLDAMQIEAVEME